MAILNSFLRGQLRGRLGNQSFSHTRSATGRPETKVSTINSSPSNPRTNAQVIQRAKFAMAVKFYKRAVSNFFKFAFEDKKANESDYNAFMRHNVERCYIAKKDDVANPLFPAISRKWQMSCGTLEQIFYPDLTEAGKVTFHMSNSIIGNVSGDLIDNGRAQLGDVFTFIAIASNVGEDNISSLDDVDYPPNWLILQFIVDPSNTNSWDSLSSLGQQSYDWGGFDNDSDSTNIILSTKDSLYSIWAGCIHSRNLGTGLLASQSYLEMNLQASQLMNAMLANSYYDNAVASWQQGTTAILEGSVASKSSISVASASISSVGGHAVPWAVGNQILNATHHYNVRGSGLSSSPSFEGTSSNVQINQWLQQSTNGWWLIEYKLTATGTFSIVINGQTIITGRCVESL